MWVSARVANIAFKKSLETSQMLNVRVTAGHRLTQAPEEPAGWGRFSRFCLESQNFFCKINQNS